MKPSSKKKIWTIALSSLAVLSIPAMVALSRVSFKDKEEKAWEEQFYAEIEKDASAKKLKESLKGYSTARMEVVANKQEITKQSRAFINAFNKFYGTNLSFTQVGGSMDYGQYLATKFLGGNTNVLLVSAGSVGGYRSIWSSLIDTKAQDFLNIKAKDFQDNGQYIINNEKKNEIKHFMSGTTEGIGVIYNKEVFEKANIVAFEGKSINDDFENKPKGLQKNSNYNGFLESNGKYYLFTDDLNFEGYKAMFDHLNSSSIKSKMGQSYEGAFYSVAQAESGNIWPYTNHLFGGAVNVYSGLNPSDSDKLAKDAEAVLKNETIEGMKKALSLYGVGAKGNEVDKAMNKVANGFVAMAQNGTWAADQIKNANPNAKIGFLPMPLFSPKDENTAVLLKTTSQRWAASTLANNEANKKTAQLFLQFMYQTKSGLEFITNKMRLFTPYAGEKPDGVELIVDGDLAESLQRYENNDLAEAVDNFLPNGFNNADDVLRAQVQGLFQDPKAKEELIKEFNRLAEK